jgi:hypothetical protein
VGTHIQRVLTKLGVHSRVEAVAFAFRHGWVPSAGAQGTERREDAVRDVHRARRQRLEPSGAVPPEGLVAILPEPPE